MGRGTQLLALVVLLSCTAAARAAPARRLLGAGNGTAVPLEYQILEPLANVVDVRGLWKLVGLPDPPKVMCHVGVLGWHCHNTTLHPWNPNSILPKDATPPMPENATCVICPRGWKGRRGGVAELMVDLPLYIKNRGSGALPPGMWDGTKLLEQAAAASSAAGQGGAAGGSAASAAAGAVTKG